MQNLDYITATRFGDAATQNGPVKMVKLRAMDNVLKNVQSLKQSIKENDNNSNNFSLNPLNETPKEEVKQEMEISNVETPASVTLKEEPKTEITLLPLTSEEVLRAKKDSLGIEAYKTLIGNVAAIKSIQETSRRLKTNPVVPGNINRARNVNGIDKVLEKTVEPEITQEPVAPKAFDFSSLPGVEEKPEVPDDKTYDNNTKLDEWLNKENGITTSDPTLNEVNDLQMVRDNTANSLANQREILEQLRARIDKNKALCEVKKKELREENMELTQELNDVLAEINKLTDIANQQEAFLGINSEEESMKFGK